eukprot:m.145122 g.145122  ORF g.145122 m.145122 type:complete len:179 (-) comp30418_c0_seq1:50-586(-)
MREFKVCLLGCGSVGKSALAVQYVDDRFVESYDPTVEDVYSKIIDLQGVKASLKIIDTAGTEQFTSMVELYVQSCEGFILVYDVTKKSSFEGLTQIKDMIWKVKNVSNKKKSPPIIVAGNKIDDPDREVLFAQGHGRAKEWGAGFMETSAKTKVQVNELFTDIVTRIDGKTKKGCTLL